MKTIVQSGKFKKDLKRYQHQKEKIHALAIVLRHLEQAGRIPKETNRISFTASTRDAWNVT